MKKKRNSEKRMPAIFIKWEKIKKQVFFFVVCSCGLMYFDGNMVLAAEKEDVFQNLHSISAVLMDADSMRILGEKNGNEKRAMASTTKILTAIIALEKGDTASVVSVTENAARQPRVHMGMKKGEKYRLNDLLYSLLLESHNDSAVAIAEHLSGSVEEFAQCMNEKAKKIGCENAYFITPNGLDAKDENGFHSITAEDLAKIMSYCVRKSPKREQFMEIARTRKYEFDEVNKERHVYCSNHNRFLDMMKGVMAGKTGFTGEAGYCYTASLENKGAHFSIALLGCGWPDKNRYKWEDARKIFEYACDTYEKVKEPIELDNKWIEVENGVLPETGLFEKVHVPLKCDTEKDDISFLKSKKEKLNKVVEIPKSIQAPAKKGKRIGKVIYSIGETKIAEIPVVIGRSAGKRSFIWIVFQIMDQYYRCCF